MSEEINTATLEGSFDELSNQDARIVRQEKFIEQLVDFSTFVIKCVRQNGEYSPASIQEPREIEAAIKEYYKWVTQPTN